MDIQTTKIHDKMNQNSRLVLGTVQLGMHYGIANTTGQPDMKTAENIVAMALDNGICEFDTAQAYGTSEAVLGTVLKRLGVSEKVKIISKLHPDLCWWDYRTINQAFHSSLARLGVRRLHGLMLHREDLLDAWDQGLGEMLCGWVQKGWVDHLGISVYSPAKARQSLIHKDLNMIQFPSNIIDRRFEDAKIFETATDDRKKIYVRSIFLQGLFFKRVNDLKDTMPCALPVLEKLNAMVNAWKISCQEICIGYAKQAYPNAQILFGAETVEQVRMNVSAWNNDFPAERLRQIRCAFKDVSEQLLNPSNWPE